MQHIYYQIKRMLRSKSVLFWMLAFPIILGILFYNMFGGISELTRFEKIPVGILAAEEDKNFVDIMESVESDAGTKMFQVKVYREKDKAMKALKDETIKGVIDLSEDRILIVKDSDIYTSIIKTFLDQYRQNQKLIEDTAKKNPQAVSKLVVTLFEPTKISIKEIPLKGVDKDLYTQYFYALIAMTCLMASMVGLNNGCDIQADLSSIAARRNVAPTPKMLQVMKDFIASFILCAGILLLVLLLCIYGFHQDFGKNFAYIMLGSLAGIFTGLAVGILIALFVKGNHTKKEGIVVAFFMISSFLGGLQWGDITYYLEKTCPIINRINPATLIVNAFKSLAVFGDVKQYAVNVGTLFLIGFLCISISVWKLRRTRYASL